MVRLQKERNCVDCLKNLKCRVFDKVAGGLCHKTFSGGDFKTDNARARRLAVMATVAENCKHFE